MPRTRLLAAIAPAALALFAFPASAPAAQRWTAPDSAAISGPCSQSAPCRIDAAVNGAAAGDEVIVAPGTYGVAVTLEPAAGVAIHGVAGQPRPWLVGTSDLGDDVINAKRPAAVSHLAVDSTSADGEALKLQGGRGEDLLLLSAGANAARLLVSPAGTLLRESVVRTLGGDDGALRLHESGSNGTITVAGVSAQGPTAIHCDVQHGTVSIVDTIARGASEDIDSTNHCSASYSNFRPAVSPGVVDGGNNQALDPLFADAAGGDLRQAAGSPTIDAGVTDPLLGSFDPAGCPRPLGAAVDIGGYEQPALTDACASAAAEPLVPRVAPPVLGPPPIGGGDGTDENGANQGDDVPGGADMPPPVIGRHVVVGKARGHVRFRRPGSMRFHDLTDAARVPVGSVIDATAGRVRLASAIDQDGTVQAGTFWGARFVVLQRRLGDGMTTLALRGGRFRACRASASGATAASLMGGIARRRVIRRLWARDHHGRFRTHGRNSVATARGTAWLTQDRCDGTRTRVARGAVAVRDLARHRTVLVRAGHAYLARRRG